jgi:hypothetical protein
VSRFANRELAFCDKHELGDNCACLNDDFAILKSPCEQVHNDFTHKSFLKLSEKEVELLNEAREDLGNDLNL